MDVMTEIKKIIVASLDSRIPIESLSNDFKLAGNILDSMTVTNLILALEEHFDFFFDDDELSIEAFETVDSLTKLVKTKIQ